jgi:hypothetical protein
MTFSYTETLPAASVQHGIPAIGDVEVRLAAIETLPLQQLVHSEDVATVIRFAETLAQALAGTDGDQVRRRLLGKLVASERTLFILLESVLASRLAGGNTRELGSLNAALDASARRLERLAAAHRADLQAARRPVLVVGHADHVNVAAG